MDVVSSVLGFTCQLYECIANNAVCSQHLADELDSLKTEKRKLVELRDDVRRKAEDAQRRGMQPTQHVDGWLRRVSQLEKDVDHVVEKGEEEVQNRCLGLCPRNCWVTHKLWKKACGQLQAVSDLKREGEFGNVAETLPVLAAGEMPLGRTVGLESVADKVLRLLRADGVGIIGVYGMGGVGKTTLLKKINKKLADLSAEFKEVIWVVASKDGNYEMVLGFTEEKWKNKKMDEKATDIHGMLRNREFVFLLDDIADRFDLERLGIPLPNKDNKAKVVFTTRLEYVCGLMEADKKIKVECLRMGEAWDLFVDKVGEEILNSDPEILHLGQMVCQECDGLLLALITVGRAMACRTTLHEWTYAINLLKKSPSQFAGMGDKVFPLLKFSYDSLPDETTKACFLYCSLYPEDWSIPEGHITVLWTGEGFFDDCDSLSEARQRAYNTIATLKLACLLERCSDDGEVRMHDMLREMALWVASECGREKNKYLVQAGLNLSCVVHLLVLNGKLPKEYH